MPTVHRQGGFNVRIYTDDHFPPHVHCVRGRENESPRAAFYLNGADGKQFAVVQLRENQGLSAQEVRAARRVVQDNHARLLATWEEIYG